MKIIGIDKVIEFNSGKKIELTAEEYEELEIFFRIKQMVPSQVMSWFPTPPPYTNPWIEPPKDPFIATCTEKRRCNLIKEIQRSAGY